MDVEVVGRLMKVSGVDKRRRETGEKVAGRFAYGGTGGARGLTRGLVVVTDYT